MVLTDISVAGVPNVARSSASTACGANPGPGRRMVWLTSSKHMEIRSEPCTFGPEARGRCCGLASGPCEGFFMRPKGPRPAGLATVSPLLDACSATRPPQFPVVPGRARGALEWNGRGKKGRSVARPPARPAPWAAWPPGPCGPRPISHPCPPADPAGGRYHLGGTRVRPGFLSCEAKRPLSEWQRCQACPAAKME